MSRIFVGASRRAAGAGREDLLEFLLLAYAAMGLAMLPVLLLLFLRKMRLARRETRRRPQVLPEEPRAYHEKRESLNVIAPSVRQDVGDGLPPAPPPFQQQRHPGWRRSPHPRPLRGPSDRGGAEALPASLSGGEAEGAESVGVLSASEWGGRGHPRTTSPILGEPAWQKEGHAVQFHERPKRLSTRPSRRLRRLLAKYKTH